MKSVLYVNFLFNKFLSKILYFYTQKQNSLEAYFTSKIRIPNELPAVSKRVRTAVNKLRGHSEVPPVESKAMAEKSNANKITRVKKTKIEKKTDDGDNNITGAARLSLVSTKLVTRKTGGRDEFIPQRERDRSIFPLDKLSFTQSLHIVTDFFKLLISRFIVQKLIRCKQLI